MDCFDDQTIARLIEPGTEPPAGFDAHLDACAACRQLVMAAARRTTSSRPLPSRPEPGQHIARYVLLQRVGEGGSGVVYSAWDPELEREVAVKLVAASLDPSHNARLLDEARTMARLTHPNVVRVYDAGTVGDSVFLAMELMSGGTLRDWQRERRSWRLVLERYLEAGRGLAAAHDLGLVHRDFKPSNVMLSAEGRACVGDFGLASFDVTIDDATEVPAGQTPKVAGTPIYMSPEAHRGDLPDARSDQYSFCVALFEALYGDVPYPGASLRSVERAKAEGKPTMKAHRGPRAVARVLAQGLRPAPADRFATMSDLLAALQRAESQSGRVASLGAIAAAALVGAAAYGLASARREPPCDEAATAIADTWNPDVALRLEAQASTLDRAASQDIVARAIERLDAYAEDWTEASVAACRAEHAGALTEDDALRRNACLDQSLAAFDGLVKELEDLDAAMLPGVSVATGSLPRVGDCDRPDTSSPIDAESVVALRELRAVRAAVDLGRYDRALEVFERIRDDAIAREDRWVAAEAGLAACSLATSLKPTDYTIPVCEHAAADGLRSGNLRASAIMWSIVFGLEAHWQARRDIAARFEQLADAAAHAVDDPAAYAALASGRATMLQVVDSAAALEQQRLAVQYEIEARGPDHPLVIVRKLALADYLGTVDRYDEALALTLSTREEVEALNGPDDPNVVQTWLLEGKVHRVRSEYAETVTAYERAIEGFTRIYGPDSAQTLTSRISLAFFHAEAADVPLDAALDEIDDALAQIRLHSSDSETRLPEWEAERAFLLQRAGRSDDAVASCQSALALARELGGADTIYLLKPHWHCGDVYFYRTELDEALFHWEAALDVCENVHGSTAPLCIDFANMVDGARLEWNMPPHEK